MKFKKLYLLLIIVSFVLAIFGSGYAAGEEQPLVLTYVLSTEPDTLDPAIWFTTSPVNLNLYQNLLEVNPEGSEETFSPMLAESYSVSEDGLTWSFEIRKGVKFHDGTNLNAQAVKFSIDRIREIGDSPSGIWKGVEEMKVLSDYEIEFKLSAPIPFDYMVAGGYGTFMVSPNTVKKQEKEGDLAQGWMADHAIGTGPYKLREWVRGQHMIFEKFDEYWGGWQEGYPDIVVVKFVTEYSTTRMMLEKGEADMVDFVPADQVEDLRKNEGITVKSYPSYETLYFHFNNQKEPTDNRLVRKALSYAFNYDSVSIISKGNAKPARGILPSAMWGFKKDLFQYSYDPEKAKEILAEAGFKEGELTLTMAYAAQDELQRQLAEVLKSDLSKIGVNLEIEAAPWATIRSKQLNLETSYNIFSRYWWPDYIDPHDFVLYLLRSDQSSNYSYYKNPEVDRLIDEAHKIAGHDREKAIEMYQKIQEIVVEDAQSIFVLEQNWLVPMRTWVKDYVYNPAYPRIVKFYGLKLER